MGLVAAKGSPAALINCTSECSFRAVVHLLFRKQTFVSLASRLCRYLEDNFVAYMQKVVAAHRTQVGRAVG